MPRKTSFCNAALLRSDIKRYWPLLFLYVAVWVVILPMQILSASRECDGVAEGIMTVLQLRQHNVIIQSIPASVVMSLLFGCFAAMAVWSYLMSGRTVGLMHALPVTRTQAFFSHVLSALGALTAGNVLIFLLTALCSAGFSYVDWAALGTWLLLTELMALFFFALGSLCAMVTGWLLAVPVLLLARLIFAYRLYSVDPVLTNYYLELLGLMLLILASYRLSGFAVQAGGPRMFGFYADLTAILAVTLLADGHSAALLPLGGAAALDGFQRAMRMSDIAEKKTEE